MSFEVNFDGLVGNSQLRRSCSGNVHSVNNKNKPSNPCEPHSRFRQNEVDV